MTTTFNYINRGEKLFIDEVEGDMRITVADFDTYLRVRLNRVGRDALRNYLDGLEEDEVEEQTERVMWANVVF